LQEEEERKKMVAGCKVVTSKTVINNKVWRQLFKRFLSIEI
jgi:hypothetical protein